MNAEGLTCCIDNAICTDGSVRSLDIPFAITGWVERGDRGWVVDLGTVHTSTSSQGHSQRVRVNVAVPWGVETCQHLKIKKGPDLITRFG